jgi:hypothetical protein
MADPPHHTSSLDSTFPVDVPFVHELGWSDDDFFTYIRTILKAGNDKEHAVESDLLGDVAIEDSSFSGEIINAPSLTTESEFEMIRSDDCSEHNPLVRESNELPAAFNVDPSQGSMRKGEGSEASSKNDVSAKGQSFIEAGATHRFKRKSEEPLEEEEKENKKMLTENGDVAFRTTHPLVDLFFEAEETVSGPRLLELLGSAWKTDPESTLKIIFAFRSIHLGKGERDTFYRCYGWLASQHPITALQNLKWIVPATIPVKPKKYEVDSDTMVVDRPDTKEVPSEDEEYIVQDGGAHGYWKDLLEMLKLAVMGKFGPLQKTSDILSPKNNQAKRVPFNSTKQEARDNKHKRETDLHNAFLSKFNNDPFYRTLHLSIARLFAGQLRKDMDILSRGSQRSNLRNLSLAAKWAPSLEKTHDKHTFIASSIAELLYPRHCFDTGLDRYTYLKHAREAYHSKTLSPLRKALQVIERDICANSLSNVNYQRVPSRAMQRYQELFLKRDEEHFTEYLEKVAAGTAKISGAVLTPSVLVRQVLDSFNDAKGSNNKSRSASLLTQAKGVIANGQWKTLVERIRDAGILTSSIAVVDVSGSMYDPMLQDHTYPIDSSVGLGLLIAEVTEPPFGGAVITFSEKPSIFQVGGPQDKRTFTEKVRALRNMDWGMNTDFVAVFEKLILPTALKDKLNPKDMVKRVFVFSDMHFDDATDDNTNDWDSSYERIKTKFEEAGYEMPEMVFWNLAGGRAAVTGYGDPTAPKPVEADQPGTSLVNGYSQALVKVFMEGGDFSDVAEEEQKEEDEAMAVEKAESGAADVLKEKVERKKKDPLDTVKKAISHKAYQMLKVVD